MSQIVTAPNLKFSMDGIAPGNAQAVTVGSSSTQSAAFGAQTTIIEVVATVACFIAVGTNPTAVLPTNGTPSTGDYIPANVPRFYQVAPGQKLAVIEAASGGTLYINEGA